MIKRLWQLGRAQRWKMTLQLVGQWLSKLLIVSVIWAGAQQILTGHVSMIWGWLIGGQLLVTFGYLLLSRRLSQNGWAVAASQELQDQFLRAYLKTNRVDADSVMQVVHQDLSTIKRIAIFFDTIIPTIIELALTGIVMLAVGLVVKPWTVLIPLAGILLLGMGMGLLQGLGDRKNLAYIQSFNQMGRRFLDDFLGMSTLIMAQRQRQYAADFQADAENFRQKTMGVLEYQLQSLTIMDFCLYGAVGFFLLALGKAVAAATVALPTAIGLGVLTAVWLIDFRKFGYFMHVFMSTLPKLKHLFQVIDAPTPAGLATETAVPPVQQLTLSGTIGYTDGLLTVDQLTLAPGHLIGLTGPSGSGKSTLAQTLMLQLPLRDGTLTVNQTTDLTTVSPLAWLKRAAYLGPTTVLFDGSIEDNLLLAGHPADWQARLRALKLCRFVETLPAGFATPVGENGAQLSPGQRQQIAVGRAVLADKDLYVFDEVTSNIDPENADQIMRVIQQLATHKAVLLITHRLADLQNLSSLRLIDQGRLVSGDMASLQAQVPAFAALVAEQRILLREAGIQ